MLVTNTWIEILALKTLQTIKLALKTIEIKIINMSQALLIITKDCWIYKVSTCVISTIRLDAEVPRSLCIGIVFVRWRWHLKLGIAVPF